VMRAVPFDDGLLTIFSPDLSCTYLLDQLRSSSYS